MRRFYPLTFLLLIAGITFPLKAQYFFNVKQTFHEIDHQVFFTGYSDKGNYVVTSGSENNIIIWNAESGIIYRTLVGLKKRPNDVFYAEDVDLLFSGGEDQLITSWNTKTLEITGTFRGHQGPIKTIDISPDRKLLASGSSDQMIRIWDIGTHSMIFEFKEHKNDVNSVQFSPDGKLLASGSADKKLILWNVSSGSIKGFTQAHNGWIRDVKFSPDGKLMASCGDDKLIKIWTVPDLVNIKTLKGHKNWVQTIDFTPDGKYLVSGGHDQLIILWDIDGEKALYQSEKQGQIVLSVDISPVQPDLISSCLLSENINKWALSGLDMAQWQADDISSPKQSDEEQLTEQVTGEYPQIEVFSPEFINNVIEHDQAEIYIVGRIQDPAGINALLLNRKPVSFSETGIFQINQNLIKGENRLELAAINNQGKRTTRSLLVHCTSGISSTADQAVIAVQTGKYYALLIGINDYADEGLSDLDNPVNDMENLYWMLHTKYTFDKENITLLKNPTRNEIIVALDRLGGTLSKNDNLLIFYAGHGYWDEKGNVGYWMPADATMQNTVNWFRNSTLRDFIGSIQSRHTFLIADACFSGAIFKTRAAFPEPSKGIQKLYELPSRKAMTSGILQEVPDESINGVSDHYPHVNKLNNRA